MNGLILIKLFSKTEQNPPDKVCLNGSPVLSPKAITSHRSVTTLADVNRRQVARSFTSKSAFCDVIYTEGDIIFAGGSAEEAEDFIFAVKKRVYSKGKHKDNIWIAEYVSTCFAKKALRWYERLDEETQDDWKLLKRAILDKYEEDPLPSSMVPTSASINPRCYSD